MRELGAAGPWAYFDAIEPRLYRYPALDPATFRAAMREAFGVPTE